MRISTHTMFEYAAARFGELQSELVKTQQQIATNRRILTPSDDPVAAAQVLEITQSQSLNNRFDVNRQHAKTALGELDGTLESVTELIQDVKTSLLAAENDALNDTQRGVIATEMRGRLDQLLGLANTRDAVGNYLFSGFQSATPAFSQDAVTGVVSYDGDAGQRHIQVDAQRQMSVTNPGSTVFQGAGWDMFQTLNDLAALLDTPGVPSSVALDTHNANLDKAMDSVLSVRAAAGARLQELDALDYAGDDRNLQYSQALSELQDLDYAKALTQLSQQQITLEAAQQSFVKTANLSLFNFI